ncbi:FAD:protein FMN transferase ApbE [Candidatus Pantoea carbekii]|uniref:FAD:protein FMN transferase n=1 Tax=Candidatus Pantoea carbekii TaxID=1235990 RepID=U3U6E8_9GAMM|nr:FAD:protein FMN transferase ApbE [Candidatus Pantoea carbekii]AKC32008.1 thiamine biosynthesis lipoprotein ApbE [Candidatus Pantoea carbekii]BAO00530.1 ApbE protein [Candidatus Pantoea carbekii]
MRFQKFLLIILAVQMLNSCNNHDTNQGTILHGKTMGTIWTVHIMDIKNHHKDELRRLIQEQLDRDDNDFSTWKTNSALSHFNRYQGSDPQPISIGMADIVTEALRIGMKTGGYMNIMVGPLVNLWGFGPMQEPLHTPNENEIASAKALTNLEHLRLIQDINGQWLQKDLPSIYVDLSTMGEGYATDHLARLMEEQGITNYLVSVGGAVLCRGKSSYDKPWKVAIQKPTDRENAVEARVELKGHGISTAGSYRNYYELDGKRISHIIDPSTGRPINHNLVSATVIATTALEADGWDTALLVIGTERAKMLALKEHLAVYLITKEGKNFTHWISPQFKSFLVG